ncbi:MAG: cell division protein FtsZ [Pseudomonadota bacterium]|nr:cell division protein FtsZ [Pseudomonadota bacterium]
MNNPLSLGEMLAVLAGVVVLALLLQGWWRTRRAQERRTLGWEDGRIEPGLDGQAMQDAAAAEDAAERIDSADDDPAADALAVPPTLRLAQRRTARLDALIDAIASLTLEAPISAEAALQHLPSTRRIGSKALLVEGLNTESGLWEPLTLGQRYGELQAGVQLANRTGALNQIEYSEFVQKLQSFADAVGAGVDAPDMLEVAARARELDAQSSPLDAQLSVQLRANGAAWSVAYLQQIAARQGFVPGAVPGRLVLPSTEEGDPPLLVLAVDAQAALAEEPQASAVRVCTLTLDVPQSPASAEPFPAWHSAATHLAKDLDATAVDHNGHPITLHAYSAIGEELQQVYAKLEALDLAAGSAAARRLFS